MELKLNVYEGKNVVKTYTTRDFLLPTGICEDILKLVDLDKFQNGFNDETATMEILKVVIKSFTKFRPLMQDIFEGLTDDEYDKTAIKEVARVVINIITYTITELFTVPNSKN